MSYTVQKVGSRRLMRDFLNVPDRIYRGDANYVAPLKSEVRRTLDARKNPYFKGAELSLFVCYANGCPVARVAAVIQPRHEQKFGVRTAFFGFFECINDQEAAKALFAGVTSFCREKKAAVLEGPFNPNHYSELGMLIDHFDEPPVFFQTYNPSYYPALLEGLGFRVSASLFTAKNDRVPEFIREHDDLDGPISIPEGYTVRHPDMSRLREEMETIRLIFNDAFDSNWHFLSASKEEYDFSVKFLRLITDPSLISIIEYRGKPAAVLMFVLDVNPLIRGFHGRMGPLKLAKFLTGRRRIRTVVLYAGGSRQHFRRSRVYPLMYQICGRTISGFDRVEGTWIKEENVLARRSGELLGMREDKHFAIYALAIVPETNPRPTSDNSLTNSIQDLRTVALGVTTEERHG